MQLAAPAKVNFGLRVVGRQADGLHRLESLFLPLDLADGVELEVSEARPRVELRVQGGDAEVPDGSDNLAARAAERFLAVAGLRRSVRIRLTKRIPAAAGLGGGSSDAGAVLRGLSRLLPGALEASALEAIALQLGADVPFFLDPRPSLVTGVGEQREPLAPGWPAFPVLLANPGEPLPTGRVFAAFDAAPAAAAGSRRPLAALLRDAPSRVAALQALLENDLLAPARELCPAIGSLLDTLRDAGASACGMSGSGATVFGVFPDQGACLEALRRFEAPIWARVATTAESG